MKRLPRYIILAALPFSWRPAAAPRASPKPPAPADEHAASEHEAPASVTLTPAAVAAAEIRTAAAAVRPVARRYAAAGELEWNARRVVHLTARTPGRLERVAVVQGDRVREGQLLAEIYSPDFLTLQAEYIQAAGQGQAARRRRGRGGPGPGRARAAPASG